MTKRNRSRRFDPQPATSGLPINGHRQTSRSGPFRAKLRSKTFIGAEQPSPGVVIFDCGEQSRLNQLAEGGYSENAIAVLSTNALKQNSWYRTPATHPVKFAGLR
jgi:hypothetical protein